MCEAATTTGGLQTAQLPSWLTSYPTAPYSLDYPQLANLWHLPLFARISQVPAFGHFLCHLPLGLAIVGHEDGHGVSGVAGRWRRVITLGWCGMITRAPSCQHSAV